MTCPINLGNDPEWSVHMWSKWDSLSSQEICNLASTVEKTNISNVKNNRNGRKNDCNWKVQEIELLLAKCYFSYFLVPFRVVHTLWNLFRNRFAPFFEWSGIALIYVTESTPIYVADSIRAVGTRNLSVIKIILEWHLSAKCEHCLRLYISIILYHQ